MEGANITVAIAFLAGLASFLSPCVLPLVPGYISLISGVSIDNLKASDSRSTARRAVIFNSLAFNAGLSIIFLALGATAGWVGAAVLSNRWVSIIGGLVIVGFGLQLMGVLKIGALYRDTRKFSNDKPSGVLGSFALGMAFAAGWTPCIGPILGGIIGLAATSGGWQSGLLLSSFYAAGLAVPFLLTGLGINRFLSFYGYFKQHLHKVEVVSGVVLIVIGLLIASGYATLMAQSGLATLLPNAESWVQRLARSESSAPQANQATTANVNAPPAPSLTLRTLEGESFNLSDLRGQVVLLNFWATWCVPCAEEIPHFNELQRELGGQGFKIVGVEWDSDKETIQGFKQDRVPLDYTVLVDGNSIGSQFGVGGGLPVTFIIDREGRIRERIFGSRDKAGFENLVKPLLAEAASTASN